MHLTAPIHFVGRDISFVLFPYLNFTSTWNTEDIHYIAIAEVPVDHKIGSEADLHQEQKVVAGFCFILVSLKTKTKIGWENIFLKWVHVPFFLGAQQNPFVVTKCLNPQAINAW